MQARAAFDRIAKLYTTSPLFQDLLETGIGTGVATAGQALFTDMTPEELALSGAAAFAAGMIGRPVLGAAGQYLGNKIDRAYPELGEELVRDIDRSVRGMPEILRKPVQAKLAPYRHLGGASQYANMIGRGYGDNLAQGIVALTAPGIFSGKEEEEK